MEAVSAVAEDAQSLKDKARALGIELRSDQALRGLPGTASLSNKEYHILKGLSGEGEQAKLELFNQRQKEQVAKALETELGYFTKGVDIDNLDVKSLAPPPGSPPGLYNFLDRAVEFNGKQIKNLRLPIEEIARDRQVIAPAEYFGAMNKVLREKFGTYPGLFNSEGNVNNSTLQKVAKEYGGSGGDRSFGLFASEYMSLKRLTERSPGGFSGAQGLTNRSSIDQIGGSQIPNASSNIPPVPSGVGEAGLTFRQAFGITDRLQDLAYSKGNEGDAFNAALKEIAFNARRIEGDAAIRFAKETGNSDLALLYEDAHKNFIASKEIGDKLSQTITRNIDTVGQTILDQGKTFAQKVMLVASDKQKQEIRASILQNLYLDSISNSGGEKFITGVNPTVIKKRLFGDAKKTESTISVFGEDTANNLKAILNIAETIKPSQIAASSVDLAKTERAIQLMTNMKDVSMSKAVPLFKGIFGKNYSASQLIDERMPNIISKIQYERNKSSTNYNVANTLQKAVNYGLRPALPALIAGKKAKKASDIKTAKDGSIIEEDNSK